MKILKTILYSGRGSFDYDENNIVFNYTVPEYKKYLNAEYQYLLEGFQDDWSEWSTKTAVSLKTCLGEMCLKLLNLQILYRILLSILSQFLSLGIETVAHYFYLIIGIVLHNH
jgi:hypothetical protein